MLANNWARLRCLWKTVMAGQTSNGEKLIGKVISGYVLVEVVSTCRWGPVFSAIQTSMDRAVALKVLAPEFTGESDQFLAEARAAAQITHPRIVAVFEAGFADGYYFCATEFTDGPPLAEFLHKGDAVDEHRLLDTIVGLAEALDTLSEETMVTGRPAAWAKRA